MGHKRLFYCYLFHVVMKIRGLNNKDAFVLADLLAHTLLRPPRELDTKDELLMHLCMSFFIFGVALIIMLSKRGQENRRSDFHFHGRMDLRKTQTTWQVGQIFGPMSFWPASRWSCTCLVLREAGSDDVRPVSSVSSSAPLSSLMSASFFGAFFCFGVCFFFCEAE